MKKILIDVASLHSNNQNAMLGIKYFISKNKDDELTVIGDSNDTVTIHQNKRIIIAQTDNDDVQIDEQFKNVKEKNIRILFTLLKKDKYDSFITFDSLDTLKPYIDKYFVKKSSPLLVASYANFKTHKCTIFGDLGYNLNPSLTDMGIYLKELKDYAKNVYNFKTTKYKLMSSLDDKNYKNDKDYEGRLLPKDLYNANVDIILTDAYTCSTVISSVSGAIETYDNFIHDQVKKSFGLRYFVFPMFRSVTTAFHMNIDKKLTSGGITLLGFDKKIIFIEKDTIAMGVKASIDMCVRL